MPKMIDHSGQKIGELAVIKRIGRDQRGILWLCKCACGNEKIFSATALSGGSVSHCGCMLRFNLLKRKKIIKNETGNKYGRLTVIELQGKNKHHQCLWICRCDCGNETAVLASALRNGTTKSCGCLARESVVGNRKAFIDETGNRYGKLIVIERIIRKKAESAEWLCQCDCGNKTIVPGQRLRHGFTRSCGCLRKLPKGEASLNAIISLMKDHAKIRNREWTLTRNEVKKITKQRCFYCNAEPSNIQKAKDHNGSYTYSGIDRKDNSRGYYPENVVPACKFCNWAKRDLTIDEFKSWIERVHSNFIKPNLLNISDIELRYDEPIDEHYAEYHPQKIFNYQQC